MTSDTPVTSLPNPVKTTEPPRGAAVPPTPEPPRVDFGDRQAILKRLVASLFAGFVLAVMVGGQEGSQTDFGISFFQATSFPRLLYFLLVGVAIFLVITF